jgi:hypothetical protein
MRKLLTFVIALALTSISMPPAVSSTVSVDDLISVGTPVELTTAMDCRGEQSKFIWCTLTLEATSETGGELSGKLPVRLCSSPFWNPTMSGECQIGKKDVWSKTIDVTLGEPRKVQFPNRLRGSQYAEISAMVLGTQSFVSTGRIWQISTVKPLKVTLSHPDEVVHGENVRFTVWTAPRFTGTCKVSRDSGMGWKVSNIRIKNGKGAATVRYLWQTPGVRTNYIKVECSNKDLVGMTEKYLTGYKN